MSRNKLNIKMQLHKRIKELDVLMEKVFEEYAFGRLDSERYQRQTGRYQTEQKELTARVSELQTILAQQKANDEQLESFIKKTDSYTDIRELTAEILTAFIEKIFVHERPPKGTTTENGKLIGNGIEIYLRCGIKLEMDSNSQETSLQNPRQNTNEA